MGVIPLQGQFRVSESLYFASQWILPHMSLMWGMNLTPGPRSRAVTMSTQLFLQYRQSDKHNVILLLP